MLWFLFCFCGSSDGFQRLRNRKYFIFRFDDHHHNKIVAISVIGCVIRMNGVPPRAARGEAAFRSGRTWRIATETTSSECWNYRPRVSGSAARAVVQNVFVFVFEEGREATLRLKAESAQSCPAPFASFGMVLSPRCHGR